MVLQRKLIKPKRNHISLSQKKPTDCSLQLKMLGFFRWIDPEFLQFFLKHWWVLHEMLHVYTSKNTPETSSLRMFSDLSPGEKTAVLSVDVRRHRTGDAGGRAGGRRGAGRGGASADQFSRWAFQTFSNRFKTFSQRWPVFLNLKKKS